MNLVKLQVIVLIILVVAVVMLGALILDVRQNLAIINNQLEHLEEEIHEAGAAIKRTQAQETLLNNPNVKSSNQPKAMAEKTEHDFGQIRKADGVVKTDFIISNAGESELLIGDITTSCSCTSAQADKKKIASGGKATLTVNFDPNFHEEPEGRFSRSVFVPTNDPANKEIEFKIFVEIEK